MASPYWQYFVALETDFDNAIRYVELHRDNFATYSVEFARLMLAACSEVEVVSKLICDRISPGSKPDGINKYRTAIHSRYPGFHKLEVSVPRYGLQVLPWSGWATGDNPTWWRSFNKIKHERHNHFQHANLENALNALAGLFVAVLYLYPTELCGNVLQLWPTLLTLDPNLNSRLRNDFRSGFILPDFL